MRARAESRWTPAWFAVVGAQLGALAGPERIARDPRLGATPASALADAPLVVSTGALHQDGLADCADALGVGPDRARRLAVMREPQVGVFGALAVLFWLVLMVSAVSGLRPGDAPFATIETLSARPGDALRALIAACALGRWSALLHAVLTPPARSNGLGAAFHVGRLPLAVASASAIAVAAAVESPAPAASALAAAALTSLAVTAWARSSLAGRTGDTLGACVALVEVLVCLLMLGFAGR